jgi:hypothetical protein
MTFNIVLADKQYYEQRKGIPMAKRRNLLWLPSLALGAIGLAVCLINKAQAQCLTCTMYTCCTNGPLNPTFMGGLCLDECAHENAWPGCDCSSGSCFPQSECMNPVDPSGCTNGDPSIAISQVFSCLSLTGSGVAAYGCGSDPSCSPSTAYYGGPYILTWGCPWCQ